MNQILSTSMPVEKNRRGGSKRPVDLSKILKFFGIAILIFGVLLLATGGYAIIKGEIANQEESINPTISIENKTDDIILLKITHKKNITKVEYWWNEQEKTVINGNSGKYLEKEVELPAGTNTLHVLVYDEDGNQIPYEKQYELDSNIKFEVSDNKIKITYDGNKKLSYMAYKWDDGDETKVSLDGEYSFEQEIDALKGLHKLTVTVVDKDNNYDTKSQKINGVSKPKLELDVDDERQHFVIRTSDDELLKRIEIRLNQDDDQTYMLNLEGKDYKELEYVLPIELQSGENIIEVKVYNSNDVYEESGMRIMKQ